MYHIEQYHALQWAIIFISYCIFGWMFESTYCTIKSGQLQNRGFCHGPWIPIYGTGATLLVLIAGTYRENHLAVFLIGVSGGSALELVTGYLMEKIFKMRWWDYSQNPFNFHGYISLYTSIGWGFLALVIMDYVHPHIERISANWSFNTFLVMTTMLYTLFIEDVILSTIAAMDLRKRLENLAENSEEIKRLRISIQEAQARMAEARKEWDEGMEQLSEVQKQEGNVAAAQALVSGTVKAVHEGATAYEEKMKVAVKVSVEKAKIQAEERWQEYKLQNDHLESRLNHLLDGGSDEKDRMSWWVKTMLRNNPDAVSKESNFHLLKEAAFKRREKTKKKEENKQ